MNWNRGRTLVTSQTKRWTKVQFEQNDIYEKAVIFSNFKCLDNGKSRERVCTLETNNPDYEANAKLIAAAPDLLKAAQAALKILEDVNHHQIDWVRGTVRNAIEKALK